MRVDPTLFRTGLISRDDQIRLPDEPFEQRPMRVNRDNGRRPRSSKAGEGRRAMPQRVDFRRSFH
jgi:hypothetical protein